MVDEETDPAEIWERQRRAALRTFRVLLDTGEWETIFAHFWDHTGPGGHWNFYTVEPSGRKTIRDCFNSAVVRRLKEIHDHGTDAASYAMMIGARNPSGAAERPHDQKVH
jgi:hypothetical protein